VLGGTAGFFYLFGADFVGATQLLVYVGGTLVLVVFGVMLTAQGPFITMKTGAAEWAVATFVGLLLYGVIGFAVVQSNLARSFPERASADPSRSNNSERLGQVLVNDTTATPQAVITGLPEDKTAAWRQPMGYLLPFEIVSVHLLVVLIGAAYLARAKRRRGIPT
jgi:NADH-quinone oxidoreductase subunit J